MVDGLELYHDLTCVVCDHKVERTELKKLLSSNHGPGTRDGKQFMFRRIRDVDMIDSKAQEIQNKTACYYSVVNIAVEENAVEPNLDQLLKAVLITKIEQLSGL